MKFYKANVARTVSWIDASDGINRGLIHQDFKSGNCGPAFRLWRVGRTSVLSNPSNDHVAMCAFGGGDVTRNVDTAEPIAVSLQHPACNIAFSNSGRFLAASGMYELTVLDTEDDTVKMRVQANDLPFLGASLMSFTTDESRIILVGDSGAHLWDIPTSTQRSTVIEALEPWINAIAVTPNDNLIVCSDDWVRRYDFDGTIVASLADKGAYLCSVARYGDRFAISADGELKIYDLNSNRILHSLSLQGATALAMSSTGNEVAVGDYNGRVAVIDTETGMRR
jgi:WD40 repeat protein